MSSRDPSFHEKTGADSMLSHSHPIYGRNPMALLVGKRFSILALLIACAMALCLVPEESAGSGAKPGEPPPVTTVPTAVIERIEGLPGPIVLMGGTFIDSIGEEFVRLSGGNKARLVIIPTAYGPTEEEGEDQFIELWNRYKPASVEILHTRDRDTANDPEFSAPLRRATGVWLTGGKQVRLVDTYEGTLVQEELMKVLQRGGALGGNCAGAMALGELMIVKGKEPVITRRGLAIVPKLITDSHFLERNRIERLRGLVEAHPDHFGIGVDSKTAVVLEKGTLRVIGKSYVITLVPFGTVHVDAWAPGDEIELKWLFEP